SARRRFHGAAHCAGTEGIGGYPPAAAGARLLDACRLAYGARRLRAIRILPGAAAVAITAAIVARLTGAALSPGDRSGAAIFLALYRSRSRGCCNRITPATIEDGAGACCLPAARMAGALALERRWANHYSGKYGA